jgi:Ketol-acid reductoisomerase
MYEGGIANMNYSISNNAEYGEYVTGPEVINEESRKAMRNALKRIQSGEYAKMFISEGRLNYPSMTARRRQNADTHRASGGQLRSMMPWIAKNKLVDQTATNALIDRSLFSLDQGHCPCSGLFLWRLL